MEAQANLPSPMDVAKSSIEEASRFFVHRTVAPQGAAGPPSPGFLSSWLLKLASTAATPATGVTEATEDPQTLRPTGLGFLFVQATSQRPIPSWWRQYVDVTGPADRRDYLLTLSPQIMVHWPSFLAGALEATGSPLRLHVVRLLHEFAEVVEQHDWILGYLLRQWRFLYKKLGGSELYPTFFGQRDWREEKPREIRIFEAHLTRLLSDDAFLSDWTKALDEACDAVVAHSLRPHLGSCGVSHDREKCDACVARKWQRRHTMLLDSRYVRQYEYTRNCVKRNIQITELRSQNPWVEEARWLANGLNSFDGTYRVHGETGRTILVVKLGWFFAAAKMLQRPTPLLPFEVRHSLMETGVRVKKAIRANFPSSVFAPRPTDLGTFILRASGGKWVVPDALENDYELFDLEALGDWLNRSRVSKQRYKRARRTHGDRHQRRVVTLIWRHGETQDPIKVVMRSCLPDSQGRTWAPYFTTPFAGATPELLKEARLGTSGRVLVVKGEPFWSINGLSYLAKLNKGRVNPLNETLPGRHRRRNRRDIASAEYKGGGEPEFPQMSEFIDWALEQRELLTPSAFKKLVYDARLPDRQLAVLRGERGHIGRFTAQEDEVISTFFNNRAPGNVLKEEWDAMHHQLPHRSLSAIRVRHATLAFRYAQKHGWAAYYKSGWRNVYRIAQLHKKWARKGVGP